jgi:uncharacterized membrane-anchored protein
VAAITYYLVGLLSYVYSALIEQGVKLDKTLTVGISVPIVLVMVWLGTRGLMHAMLPKKEQQPEQDSSGK